jgi:hypothetical protein
MNDITALKGRNKNGQKGERVRRERERERERERDHPQS